MNKKAILITVVSVLALLILMYLVLSTKLVTVKPETGRNIDATERGINKTAVDPQKLEDNYKAYVKAAIIEFERLLNPYFEQDETVAGADAENLASPSQAMVPDVSEIHLSELSKLKISLMDVTVPQDFQNLHIELVKLFTNARIFLESQDEKVKNDNLALLEKIKIDYPWVVEQ